MPLYPHVGLYPGLGLFPGSGYAPLGPVAVGLWTPRVRTAGLVLTDPFRYTELTLVERYGQPDTLMIVGDLEDLETAKLPGNGVVVWDDKGNQRFSGVPPANGQMFLERRGDGTGTLVYASDLQRLWDRFCWPTPAAAWNAQTTAYDVQTAVTEDRIIGYITRNAGSTAYHSGGNDRRVPNIRVPATLGRGTTAKTSARFQNLGQLVAELAESADLRVTVKQTYESGSPYLDVVIDNVPDYSAWARFGDAWSGDLGLLDDQWRYAIGPGASVILSAAGEALENRRLDLSQNTSIESAWGRRIEFFLDQRGSGTEPTEIAEGIATAKAENAPPVEVEAPIVTGDLEFGTGEGAIPVGAKVTVSLDGELIVDRVRQVTTTLKASSGETTISVQPFFGTPDAGLTLEQKVLRRAVRRLTNLERTL